MKMIQKASIRDNPLIFSDLFFDGYLMNDGVLCLIEAPNGEIFPRNVLIDREMGI